MKKYILKISLLLGFFLILSTVSCRGDFLEASPTDAVGIDDATKTADNLMAIINGMHRSLYYRQDGQGYSGIGGQMIIQDSYGEDLVHPAVGLNWHVDAVRWQTQANETSVAVSYPYSFYYKLIRNANTIIAKGPAATGDAQLRDKAIGEAYAYRGFLYFQLVQLFASRYIPNSTNSQPGVPLRLDLSFDPLKRSTVEECYTQINSDLNQAVSLLTGKTRLSKSHYDVNTVRGIKARVALTQGSWQEAATQASLARSGFPLMTNTDYVSGFNKIANGEWIWGSEIVADQTDGFGNFAAYMSRNYNSSTIRLAPKAISKLLYDGFPASDVRKKNFDPTGLHSSLGLPSNFVKFPYTSQKFLAVSVSDSRSDVPLMRSGEMYLIEAEALARLGNEAGSKTVFNLFAKNRDTAYPNATTTGQAYIDEILKSRRFELWGEGFRFFDLKRLGQGLDRTGSNHNAIVVNNVFTVAPTDFRWTYLIPKTEMDANPLCTQNPK